MSFKFNFFDTTADGETQRGRRSDTSGEEPKAKKTKFDDGGGEEEEDRRHSPEDKKPARPFHEVSLSQVATSWHDDDIYSIEEIVTSSGSNSDVSIRFVQPHNPVDKLIAEFGDTSARNCDVITGVYEGGMKIWECSVDLMTYIRPDDVTGKSVLELGCGFGLPGLLAHHMGARCVHFQDYNESVLVQVTAPSAMLQNFQPSEGAVDLAEHLAREASASAQSFRFFSGDWSHVAENLPQGGYDVILTSETIYEEANYPKLHACLKKLLQPHGGVVLLAAKSYYFGVGGGVSSWCDYVREEDYFDVQVVKTLDEHLVRNILEMRVKS